MKEAAPLLYDFGGQERAWGHTASLSRNLGVRPVLASLPPLASLPGLLRGLGAEPPANLAWLRLRRAGRLALNYRSQKAMRNREGSGGGGRKGASGGGRCPVSGRSGCPRLPDPGRGPQRLVHLRTLAGASLCLRPLNGPGAGCRALGAEAAGAAGWARRARRGWRERWSSSTA